MEFDMSRLGEELEGARDVDETYEGWVYLQFSL